MKVLASLLYKAAKEGSYVDPNKVYDILGLSEEDLLADQASGSESKVELFGKKLKSTDSSYVLLSVRQSVPIMSLLIDFHTGAMKRF